jgi:hypothetical protein
MLLRRVFNVEQEMVKALEGNFEGSETINHQFS